MGFLRLLLIVILGVICAQLILAILPIIAVIFLAGLASAFGKN